MGQRENMYENELTPKEEPIPLILPSAANVAEFYEDPAAQLFEAATKYAEKRDVLHRARLGTLGSITDTIDRPIPPPGSYNFTAEERRPLHERRILLRTLARRTSDAVIPTLREHKQRYNNDITEAQEELQSAITTPSDEEIIHKKIAVRALEIHMLDTLLNGDALTWKTIKTLADADDRCNALSEANKEKIFLEYMKTCIQRALITPASA